MENLSSASTLPAPVTPSRYGTEAQQRAYMADVLGMPRPVWTSTPRAFVADSPSKATSSGAHYAHRSHRHYGTKGEK
jgi:hypothetical protein